jgi:hypothetical protein
MLRLSCLLLLPLFLTACGGPAEDTTQTHESEAVSSPALTSADRGNGTLILGDDQYEFSVRVCDFSGETDDDMIQTLVGRGEMPDGQPFDIFVSRNEVNEILVHTISFQTGDVRTGEGTVIEAQRMRMGENWTSPHGGAGSPLIEIAGDRLSSAGVFAPSDDDSDRTEGRLEATCRS